MACWCERVGICRRRFLPEAFVPALVFIATCLNLLPTSHAQEVFPSIDCGYLGGHYGDSRNLAWLANYGMSIKTRNSSQQPALYPSEAYQGAVSHSQGDVTYSCLLPVVGTGFISPVELQPLDATVYSYNGSQMRFPADKFDRIRKVTSELPMKVPVCYLNPSNAAISIQSPPDNTTRADIYHVPRKVMQDARLMNDLTNISDFSTNREYGVGYYEQHAAVVFPLYFDYLYVTPAERFFSVIYARHRNSSELQTFPTEVLMNGVRSWPSFQFLWSGYHASDSKFLALVEHFSNVEMSFGQSLSGQWSPASPILNAVEVYGQYDFNDSSTLSGEGFNSRILKWAQAETGKSIKTEHSLYMLNLSHNQLSGRIPSTLLQMINGSLQVLDLSYNPIPTTFGKPTRRSLAKADGSDSELQGESNYSLDKLVQVEEIENWKASLKLKGLCPNGGIDSPAFELMMQKSFSSLSIKELDLSYNGIDNIETHWWDMANGLESLNLSHNEIFGEMDSFVTSMQALQKLDLSYNAMSSLPATWGKTTLTSLILLDLSHNKLDGKIYSLDELLQMNNGSLQKLDISHNNLGGTFSSSLYFFGLQNLTTAIFDQNSIQGTLNLSAWYDKLQEAAAQKSSTSSSTRHLTRLLFSFVDNNITDIYPNAKAFEDAMEILQKRYPSFTKGILLGGNPYCKGAKSYIQRYLCRYTIHDEVPRNQKGKSYVLIISICSGIVGLSMCCATFVTLWKLSKQVQALREIQEALAGRQVYPPLYPYRDLKLATRGFHKDRKLGHGAYGAVYKGVLADDTRLAVKKLFNSKRLQVLDDFLNEVVLITGIKHKNLILLKGCCIDDKHRILVYEYAEKGNLAQALWGSKAHGDLNWEQRFNICVGIARGLSYLHEELQPSIVHRDIKPENILLDESFKPKIADFGLARYFSNETSQAYYTANIAGTLGYFAPEHISEGQVSDKGDVYSYGIVVLEIVSGRKCIDHSLPRGEIYLKDWVRKLHQMGLLFDVLQPELRGTCVAAEVIKAVKIALLCVQHNPDMRPSMSQILTMLSGNLNVDVYLSEPISVYPDVQDIIVTLNSGLEYPALKSTVEEDVLLYS